MPFVQAKWIPMTGSYATVTGENVPQIICPNHRGGQQSIPDMIGDLSASGSFPFSEKTAYEHHKFLRNIFAVDEMHAWNAANLRSKTAIRTSDTRYFFDPSIVTASLGLGPGDLVGELRTFGFVFENMCVRDLRVYSALCDGSIYHYRDKTNFECDAVVHLSNGKYGLIEIKLGGNDAIEHEATTLRTLASRINEEKMGAPSFLMVLVGVGTYAYRREDGVIVVPVSPFVP